MKLRLLATIGAGVGTLAFAAPASAQTEEVAEVVVTGSRIITNGNDSPTPVTVVTTEELTAVRPGNLAESLSDMPVFTGSRGQTTNTGTNGAAGSPATSANAGNVANLRQIGPLRTLVLYDGHRAPPSTPDGYTDLDTIPQLLLQRIDVVTGGASAVYGSDAITGVVNLVTDTKFQGVKASLQGGRSDYNDADSAEAGIAFGTSLFGGRGHVMGSYENRHAAPIASKFDRPWGANVYTLQGNCSNATTLAIAQKYPCYQLSGARTSNVTAGGRVATTAALGDSQFTAGGFLVPFNHGTRLYGLAADQPVGNCGSCEIGGDGGVFNGQLRAALDMNQFYGRFDFDFTDTLHGYVSAADTLNHSVGIGNYTSNATYAISTQNAFLLPQYRTQLGTATTFNLGKIFTEIPRGESDTHSKQLFANAGLQGSLGEYKWDLSVIRSKGTFNVRQNSALGLRPTQSVRREFGHPGGRRLHPGAAELRDDDR
jgi:iron complex outermembrane receptor protein